jgi:two-component system sensor histidine kinase/response regulator
MTTAEDGVTQPKVIQAGWINRMELEKNHRILVVDDNIAIHDDFRKILGGDASSAKLEVEEAALFGGKAPAPPPVTFNLSFASQGKEAVDLMLAAHRTGERYSLVFMDVRMPPGMDGIETAVRLWEIDSDLQIVICTAYSDKSWEEMMAQVPNPERLLILKKPFDTIEVLQLSHALTEKWALLQSSRHNLEEMERTVNVRTRELQTSEERFRKLSADAPIGIFEADAAGLCTYSNPYLQKIMGLSAAETMGEGWRKSIHPDDLEAVLAFRRSVIGEGQEFQLEFRLRTPEGVIRWVHARSVPLRSEAGEVTGHVDSVEDITERRALGETLSEARDTAVESAQTKSRFLANMSHEIRTPMNGVIGMTNLLLDTQLTSEQHDFAQTIRTSAEGLLTLINDILDLSKMEAGKMTFEELDFNLHDVVEGSLELLGEQAHLHRDELSSFIEPGTPVRLMGDTGRIRQVLMNLVSNAIKFTQSGEVVVRVFCPRQDEKECELRFQVSDTGIGIAPEVHKKLFEAFSQADASTTRKFGGTGLGLVICKQLIEKMNGAIGLESLPGEGSTFWFTLRLQKQGTPEATVDHNHALVDKRVMIVDDNATNGRFLHDQITAWKMRNGTASNGADALDLLRKAAAQGDPYPLAIIDMEMPGMNGLDLAHQIKADPTIAATRLILLTGFGRRISQEELQAAGITDWRYKPVWQSTLFECLAGALLGPKAAPYTIVAPPAPSSRHRERVLVAEDNAVNQKITLAQLRKLGYTADAVANGLEAVQAIRKIPYDIILMDCQMPELDGYEATERIRRDYSASVYIIATTANAMEGDREKCLACGMNDYVSKPVRVDALAAALDRGRSHLKTKTPEVLTG